MNYKIRLRKFSIISLSPIILLRIFTLIYYRKIKYLPMEKYLENLKEAIRNLQIADHMTYVTFPLVNEQRLLLKIFDEICKSIINCINAMLNYEYLYKRVHLYANNEENLRTFAKCAKSYNLSNEQIKKILEILELNKKHEQSAMEFVKKDRIIILSKSLGTQILDIRRIKEYLILAKELLMNVNNKIKANPNQMLF